MKINKHHGSYNISKRTQTIKYIVVHYTGAGSPKAGCAKNNCIYFGGGNRNASAHYFIDDGGIWEYADPKTYYTWHCGDGKGKYGITNANSIGIEVCQNGDIPYTSKEISYLTELVTYLMKTFNVKAENVVRHYDASRKQCPMYYAKRSTEWNTLRKQITGSKTTTTTKPNTSTTKPQTTSQIDVDGYWGVKTTKLLQKILGTPEDGEIWGQPATTFSKVNKGGLSTTSWKTGTGGSKVIKALQKALWLPQTGVFDVATCKALQRYLGTTPDGEVWKSSKMVKALQKRLNTGKF